jgi:hypothetical protein
VPAGAEIISNLGFSGWQVWEPVLGLSGLIVGYNCLGYLSLRYGSMCLLPVGTVVGSGMMGFNTGTEPCGMAAE